MAKTGHPRSGQEGCFASALRLLCKYSDPGSGIHGLSTPVLRWFRDITSARDARHAAGLTLADMRILARAATGHDYSRGALANMESPMRRVYRNKHGRRRDRFTMPDAVRGVYADALRAAIVEASSGRVDVKVRAFKTAWRVLPLIKCRVCGVWFTPKRAGVMRCGWCIRHRQTKPRSEVCHV